MTRDYKPLCYFCEAAAVSAEHFPPRSFYPDRKEHQLRTVPSCKLHNGDKSGDDQYVLAHITMHASRADNAAKHAFLRSIAPQLVRSAKWAEALKADRVELPDREVAYSVSVDRFDRFFDALSAAVVYQALGSRLDFHEHDVHHVYLSLGSSDPEEIAHHAMIRMMFQEFFTDFSELVAAYDGACDGYIVYRNKIIAPAGVHASMSVAHTFYGIFEVISFLTKRVPTNKQGKTSHCG